MNLKKAYPFIIVFILLIASCDKIEEATTININSSEKITFDVSLEAGKSVSFSEEYNLSDNADIKNYLDKLKGVEITEAYYILKDFSGTSSMTTADISLSLANETFGPYQHNLFDDAGNATKTTLQAAKLNAVATEFYQKKKISIAIEGSHNIPAAEPNGETVTVELYLKLKFTASPL